MPRRPGDARPRWWPAALGSLVGLLLLAPLGATAQNFTILDQRLDDQRHGYTVIRVWGTPSEMGYAMGVALAGDIVTGLDEMRSALGIGYVEWRGAMTYAQWLPTSAAEELTGMVAGVKSVLPDAVLDEADLKVLNTHSDWSYACRSHSCWGRYVEAPVKTLSTRRLDYGTPFDMALHHVLCARDPSDGSTRWVNLAWPGYVTVATGVNEHGTLVSLHDFISSMAHVPGVVPRSLATRIALTGVASPDVADHLGWAETALGQIDIATGTFLNYYAPEGHGGVFTCATGGPCGAPRLPQADYYFGEVLITTNAQTDGHSVPSGGELLDSYYASGGPKDLASHFEVMGDSGLHLLSVAYRGREEMTLWAHGRGRSDRIEIEWQELFETPATDAGVGDAAWSFDGGADAATADADPGDGPALDDAQTPGADGPVAGEGDCGCRAVAPHDRAAAWLVAVMGGLVLAAGRRRRRPRGSPR